MGTQKSVREINYLLSTIIDKEFKHKGEIAEELDISPITLNKWISVSDYSFEDFNIIYTKSLREIIIEKGGVNYIKQKFNEGYNITSLADELNVKQGTLDNTITRLLVEKKVSKKELGYIKRIPKKTMKMYSLIENKGGVPYLLSCKMQGMSIYDVVEDIGEGISREFIYQYLKQFDLTYTELFYWNNVYFIPHLKKWRGTIIIGDKTYDTVLYDDIYSALKSMEHIKRSMCD